MIEAGAAFLNDYRCAVASRVVCDGDRLRVALEVEQPDSAAPLAILHRDELFVAVEKPAGMPSSPTRLASAGSVPVVLRRMLREGGEENSRLWVVHRLDAATSGVLLLARTGSVAQTLSEAFANGRVVKRYLARIAGRPSSDVGEITLPIVADGRIARVGDNGKAARTSWVKIDGDDRSTLIEARPQTGRLHQIRVHLAAIGFPILGDRVYGGPPESRLMLHALSVEFAHPATGRTLVVESPLPEFARSIGAQANPGRCRETPRP